VILFNLKYEDFYFVLDTVVVGLKYRVQKFWFIINR